VPIGRNLHRKHALEMLLTGTPIDARQAMAWGLVNRVVPAEALEAETLALARAIAAKPPATVRAGKRGFYQQMEMGIERAYALAGQVIASDFAHPEGREGMSAFIEKRPPDWKK
jgi:enoyl-CoA hydratase/carnithine racemase